MTDEERKEEGTEEEIEDLEAPAETQSDVAGGVEVAVEGRRCKKKTKQKCSSPTCWITVVHVQ